MAPTAFAARRSFGAAAEGGDVGENRHPDQFGQAAPQDVDADREQQECGEALEHQRPRLAEPAEQTAGVTIGEVDGERRDRETDNRAGYRGDPFQALFRPPRAER